MLYKSSPAGEIQKKGILFLADNLAANALAMDFRYADMVPLGRREERLQCTCEAGEVRPQVVAER